MTVSVPRQQVLIIGGGPVGLATALGLVQSGVEVAVVDRDREIGVAPRAAAHMAPVIEGFGDLGVLDDIEARAGRNDAFNFVVWETGQKFCLDHKVEHPDVRVNYQLSLGQDEVTQVFMDHLGRYPNARILLGTKLAALDQDATSVTATLEAGSGTITISADWLVAADGASSTARTLLGIPFDGMTWPDRLIATNVHADFEAEGFGTANYCLDPVYGAVVLRLGKTSLWRCAFRESADLPVETYKERLPAFFDGFFRRKHSGVEVDRSAPYRIHQRCAKTFRKGRVLLAGDAAHVTNPIGGLGLTSGFLDAYSLTETLAAVIGGTIGDEVLGRWADARRAVFHEHASPAACALKEIVFGGTAESRPRTYRRLEELSKSPEAQTAQQLMSYKLVTRSLVSGPGATARAGVQ